MRRLQIQLQSLFNIPKNISKIRSGMKKFCAFCMKMPKFAIRFLNLRNYQVFEKSKFILVKKINNIIEITIIIISGDLEKMKIIKNKFSKK